jgi:hypothetical protein
MSRFIVVLVFVRLEQRDVAAHQLVGRVHIAEDLGARGLTGLAAAVNIDLCSLLFALIAVEDAQRNIDAQAQRLVRIRIVGRCVSCVPRA